MRFEIIAGEIVNFTHLIRVRKEDSKSNIRKVFDKNTERVKTIIDGSPYLIIFELIEGKNMQLGYENENERDIKFRQLQRGLVDE